MSGKHRTPTPVMPRFLGTTVAGIALATGLAIATHPSSPDGNGRFDPTLSAAAFAEGGLSSAISRADAVGSVIASTTFKTLTDPLAESTATVLNDPAGGTAPADDSPVTAQDVIKLAKSQVGTGETNGYGGGTEYQDWYADSARAQETVARDGGAVDDYRNAAWCDIFISWLGHKLGIGDQMGSDAWTIAHAQWFKDQGRWGHKAKPGAVVFFSWSGSSSIDDIDHVGLVVKKLGPGRIKTIEGNVGDAVTKQVRSTDLVVGYGYPDYLK